MASAGSRLAARSCSSVTSKPGHYQQLDFMLNSMLPTPFLIHQILI